jgi:hypothetical protein
MFDFHMKNVDDKSITNKDGKKVSTVIGLISALD